MALSQSISPRSLRLRRLLAATSLIATALTGATTAAELPKDGRVTGPGDEVWQKSFLHSEAVLQQVRDDVLAINPAFATARTGTDFTYEIPVPKGQYTVRIGYVELLYIHPDVRVFSLMVNGESVMSNFDLPLAILGPSHDPYDTDGDGRLSTRERAALPQHYIQEIPVDAASGRIDLRFLSSIELKESIAVSWIEVRGDGADYFIDCGGEDDLPADFEDDPVGVSVLSRLGSMAFFDLRPPFGDFAESPLGKWSEHKVPAEERVLKPFSALIGFQTADGTRYALPFFRNFGDENRDFDSIREVKTLTSVRYDVTFLGFEGSITFRSPFHPGDRKLSTAPYFDIEYHIQKIGADTPPVRALFFLPVMEKREREIADNPLISGSASISFVAGRRVERGLFVKAKEAKTANARIRNKHRGIWATFDMPLRNGQADAAMTYAAFVAPPVLTVDGKPHRFQYTQSFRSLEDVATYAIRRREEAATASRAVDALIDDAILPVAIKELAVEAFSSFLLNTYLTADEQGDPWYSCMEGFCRYQATVDVEYNAAPFYVWFAPDLLRMLLDQWPRYLRQGELPGEDGAPVKHWFMAHDVGIDDEIAGQAYPHDMPVEESTNYVLLLHQYWTWLGDDAFVMAKSDTVAKLLDYVVAADQDGDGFPELGAANTIDDAPAAVQFSREQTYLAVKSAAALIAGAEVLEAAREDRLTPKAKLYRQQAQRIRDTLDQEGWLGDHYAICLDRTTEGLENPWDTIPDHTAVPREAMRALPEGEMPGWNHAHPYTSLGLLYLMRAGVNLPVDEARLITDLRTAADRCARRYADGHTETEVNGWVSLDLFRDAVQCYLGDDALDRAGRYMALQRYRARASDMKDRAGFCDSYYNRYLSYYPRGTAVFALIDAAAGISLDRRAGTLTFKPVRKPIKVPLPYLADWQASRVPWFEVKDDGTYSLSEPDLWKQLAVTVDLSLVGGKVTKLPAGR